MMKFEIIGDIQDIEIIAANRSIRELAQLKERYGDGRWRKIKGLANILLFNGTIRIAELHWYEADGIGKRRIKIKRFLD